MCVYEEILIKFSIYLRETEKHTLKVEAMQVIITTQRCIKKICHHEYIY